MILWAYVVGSDRGPCRSPTYPTHRAAKLARTVDLGAGRRVGAVVGFDQHDHEVTIHSGVPSHHAPGWGRWTVRVRGRVDSVTRTLREAERIVGTRARDRFGRVNLAAVHREGGR